MKGNPEEERTGASSPVEPVVETIAPRRQESIVALFDQKHLSYDQLISDQTITLSDPLSSQAR